MEKELNSARLDRALRSIEQFAPTKQKSPPVRREQVLRYVKDHFYLFKKANNGELAEIAAILEGIGRRRKEN